MQNDLRNLDQMDSMIAFVKGGGKWTREILDAYASLKGKRAAPLIALTRFPTEQNLYIHDGHHRIVATWLGGREELDEDEYKVSEWTLDQYMEINIANAWFTPFDPRTEVRLPDFGAYKNIVRKMAEARDEASVIRYIRRNWGTYADIRGVKTVEGLAANYLKHAKLKWGALALEGD